MMFLHHWRIFLFNHNTDLIIMCFVVVVRFGAQVERHFSYLFHLEFVSTVSSFQSEFANFSLVLIESI